MCGRYTLTTPISVLAEHLGVAELPNFPPRYNIAPTQQAAVVRAGPEEGRRQLVFLRWGLIPPWAKDPAIGNRMINARAEGIAEKPAFRRAWKEKRCLVPSDGFYEWLKEGKQKQPYYIRRKDGKPFAFAGLWERWQGPAEILDTFTIITTAPNELVAPIHNRMPVIIPEERYDRWLDPEKHGDPDLLVPYPEEELTAYPVSTLVNSPAHDDARCVEKSA